MPKPRATLAVRSPITPFKPRALTRWGIRRTIAAYVRCARLAQEAGYDGVEIMGSEGYLINQFIAPQTNRREDEWGGTFERLTAYLASAVRINSAPDGLLHRDTADGRSVTTPSMGLRICE